MNDVANDLATLTAEDASLAQLKTAAEAVLANAETRYEQLNASLVTALQLEASVVSTVLLCEMQVDAVALEMQTEILAFSALWLATTETFLQLAISNAVGGVGDVSTLPECVLVVLVTLQVGSRDVSLRVWDFLRL